MNHKVGALLAHGQPGAAAIGLHVLANTWSRHNGTAGLVPWHTPGQLVHDLKLGRRLADMLAEVGMFDVTEDGWWIHDFDDFSDPNDDGRSAAERKREISEKRSAAGRQGGLAKAGKSPSKPDSKSVAELEQTSSPVPEPVPVPPVQVSDNPTPENTDEGVDNSSIRERVLRIYAAYELESEKRKGTKIRTDEGFKRHKREQASANPDLDRWLAERPNAPASAVAAWLSGEMRSMAYYEQVEPHEAMATVHRLREESA